ncbi:MAG: SPASM domain-containing protein, partial [Candidatus Eisenbacteria sp.]|nr:SPASM domain-containing protein [Candidatus Eisenbacteria bacterium]
LLWVSFAVESDGAVSACLAKDGDSLYVGDLRETSIQDIWNSPAFAELRLCSGRACSKYPCRECNWFAGRAKTSPEDRTTTTHQ